MTRRTTDIFHWDFFRCYCLLFHYRFEYDEWHWDELGVEGDCCAVHVRYYADCHDVINVLPFE